MSDIKNQKTKQKILSDIHKIIASNLKNKHKNIKDLNLLLKIFTTWDEYAGLNKELIFWLRTKTQLNNFVLEILERVSKGYLDKNDSNVIHGEYKDTFLDAFKNTVEKEAASLPWNTLNQYPSISTAKLDAIVSNYIISYRDNILKKLKKSFERKEIEKIINDLKSDIKLDHSELSRLSQQKNKIEESIQERRNTVLKNYVGSDNSVDAFEGCHYLLSPEDYTNLLRRIDLYGNDKVYREEMLKEFKLYEPYEEIAVDKLIENGKKILTVQKSSLQKIDDGPNESYSPSLKEMEERTLLLRPVEYYPTIKDPLELMRPILWSDLELRLKRFRGGSELQCRLKGFLLDCIKELRDKPTKILRDNSEATKNKANILFSYLIHLLYVAEIDSCDESVIFNDKVDNAVGILYLLENKNIFTKEIQHKLTSICDEITNHKVIYSPSKLETNLNPINFPEPHADASELSSSVNYQLIFKYKVRSATNDEEVGENSFFNDIRRMCEQMVWATAKGDADAPKFLNQHQEVLKFDDIFNVIDNEVVAELGKIHPDTLHYEPAQRNLFFLYVNKIESQHYAHLEDRLSDITKALKALLNSKDIELKQFVEAELNATISLNNINNVANKYLQNELLGADVNELQNYPLLTKEVLNKAFQKSIDDVTIQTISDALVKKQNISVPICECHQSEKQWSIQITDELLRHPIIRIVDNKNHQEIAKILNEPGKLHLIGNGEEFALKATNKNIVKQIVLENRNAPITVNFDVKLDDDLSIDSNCSNLIVNGNVGLENLYLASNNRIDISAGCKIKTHGTTHLRSKNIYDSGQIESSNVNFDIQSGLIVKQSALIKADDYLLVHADDEIYLKGRAKLDAKNIIIDGNSLMLNASASINAEAAKLQLKDKLFIENQSELHAKTAFIEATLLKNYNHIKCSKIQLHVKDKVINAATGSINTEDQLIVQGNSIYNEGQIEFGHLFQANLNKLFLHGVSERSKFLEYFRNKKKTSGSRIHGDKAFIVAGAYINLLSLMSVHDFNLTAIADINLGMITSVNSNKSVFLDLDLGLNVPNIPGLVKDVRKFIEQIEQGETKEALSQLINQETFIKAASCLRWLLQIIFPKLGKPLNLAWPVLMFILCSPNLLREVIRLYGQKESIEPYQVYELIGLINKTLSPALSAIQPAISLTKGIDDVSVPMSLTQQLTSLGLNLATLVLPTTTEQSLISAKLGGLSLTGLQQNSNFISCDVAHARAALTMSDNFYLASRNKTLTAANVFSVSGNTYYQNGIDVANVNNTDVKSHIQNGTSIAKKGNLHSEKFDLQKNGELNIEHANVQNDKINVSGNINSNTLATNTKTTANFNGKVSVNNAALKAGQLNINNKVHVVPSTDASQPNILQLESHQLTRGEHSEIDARGSLVVEKGENASLGGVITAKAEYVSIDKNLKTNEVATLEKGQFQATKIDNHSNIHVIGENNSVKDEPDVVFAAKEKLTNTENVLVGEGKKVAYLSEQDANLGGQNKVDNIIIDAKNNLRLSGDMEIKKGYVHGKQIEDSSKINIKTPSKLIEENNPTDVSKNDNKVEPDLVFDANEYNSKKGEIKGKDAVVAFQINQAEIDSTIEVKTQIVKGEHHVIAGEMHNHETYLDSKDTDFKAHATIEKRDGKEGVFNEHADVFHMDDAASIEGKGNLVTKSNNLKLKHVSVKNAFIDTDHINIDDLLNSRGDFDDFHAKNYLYTSVMDPVLLDKNYHLNYALALSAPTITTKNNNIYSDLNIEFYSRSGNVHTINSKIKSKKDVIIDSANKYINENGEVQPDDNLFVHTVDDVVNDRGHLKAGHYTQIISDKGNMINKGSSRYDYNSLNQIKDKSAIRPNDYKKIYDVAGIEGGDGANTEGVGLYIKANGKVINDLGVMKSEGTNYIYGKQGIETNGKANIYLSYAKKWRTWTGGEKKTIEHSTQVQPSAIVSEKGKNILYSDEGEVTSVATDFASAKGTEIYGDKKATLKGFIAETYCTKDTKDYFGLVRDHQSELQEYAVPTVIVDPENVKVMSSPQGTVDINNAAIYTKGKAYLSGLHVNVSSPVVNYSFSEAARNFQILFPNESSLPGYNLYQDGKNYGQSNNYLEKVVNLWNIGVDGALTTNSAINAVRNNSVVSVFNPSINMNYVQSNTRTNRQSVANNIGINCGLFEVDAVQDFNLNSNMNVETDALIHTKVFNQYGTRLEANNKSYSKSIGAGLSLSGDVSANASMDDASSKTSIYQNQQFNVGGTLTLDNVSEWNMKNANTNVGNLAGSVNKLTIESTLSEAHSTSNCESLNITKNPANLASGFSANSDESHQYYINQKSGIQVANSINGADGPTFIVNDKTKLVGADIISAGENNFKTGSLEGVTVKEHTTGTSDGLSTNFTDITKNPSPNTGNVNVGYNNYEAEVVPTIYGAKGTHLGVEHVSGEINTASANGTRVKDNTNINIDMRVPFNVKETMEELNENMEYVKQKYTEYFNLDDNNSNSTQPNVHEIRTEPVANENVQLDKKNIEEDSVSLAKVYDISEKDSDSLTEKSLNASDYVQKRKVLFGSSLFNYSPMDELNLSQDLKSSVKDELVKARETRISRWNDVATQFYLDKQYQPNKDNYANILAPEIKKEINQALTVASGKEPPSRRTEQQAKELAQQNDNKEKEKHADESKSSEKTAVVENDLSEIEQATDIHNQFEFLNNDPNYNLDLSKEAIAAARSRQLLDKADDYLSSSSKNYRNDSTQSILRLMADVARPFAPFLASGMDYVHETRTNLLDVAYGDMDAKLRGGYELAKDAALTIGTGKAVELGLKVAGKGGSYGLGLFAREAVVGGEGVGYATDRLQLEKLRTQYRQDANWRNPTEIENLKLRRVVNQLYRKDATVGSGSTADAARVEIANPGSKVGGKDHVTKAKNSLNALNNILKDSNLTPHEHMIAENIKLDLQDALGDMLWYSQTKKPKL